MITHDRFLEFAAAEMDFELARIEREALDHHLESCAACRAEAAALRSDARAMAELPQPRLDPERADHILGTALVRKSRRPTFRLVALAALLTLLALGALAVGAELLRESENPPFAVVPPSVAPSTAPTPASPGVTGWLVADIGAPGALPGRFEAVASSGSTFVAVGGNRCETSGDRLSDCRAEVYRSRDGREWTPVEIAQASLVVGTAVTLGGPTPGMVDVAGGEDGYVAIGYAGDDVVSPALWWSNDGLAWARPNDALFAGADLRSVVNVRGRWVVAGAMVVGDVPRGAVWWSDDGMAWSRAPDSAVFDVGGFIDYGEARGSGGIQDLATDGTRVLGVGSICDTEGTSCPTAVWTSSDGIEWARQEGQELVGEDEEVGGGYFVHGDAGFLVLGGTCSVDGCVGSGLRSTDGRTWTAVSQSGLGEIRGVGAVAGGFIVASLTQATPPGLALFASTDGRSWGSLEGLPTVEEGVVSAVDMTPTPDGNLMVAVRYQVHDGPEVSVVFDVRPVRS